MGRAAPGGRLIDCARLAAITLLAICLAGGAAAGPITDPSNLDHSDEGSTHAGAVYRWTVLPDDLIFDRSDVSSADFLASQLLRVSFIDADVSDTRFSWANLAGANFTGADMTNTRLFSTNLSGAVLDGATLTDTNLAWSNLSGASLSDTTMTGVSLRWANLAGADLMNTNFGDANLANADLSGTMLQGANLLGTNINGNTDFTGAFYDPVTTFLPAGVDTSTMVAIPEPHTSLLLILGLIGLGICGRQKGPARRYGSPASCSPGRREDLA